MPAENIHDYKKKKKTVFHRVLIELPQKKWPLQKFCILKTRRRLGFISLEKFDTIFDTIWHY